MTDILATQAREEHRLAGETGRLASQHRFTRDRLVRQLRVEDPHRWTYLALAAAVGCSPELIAVIVKRRHWYTPLKERTCDEATVV